MLFETNTATMARKKAGHLNNVAKLTETISGSDNGNMLLVPGRKGTMQLIHHGFACNTDDGSALVFAHGNIDETTSFKTVNRNDMVAPAAERDERPDAEEGSGGAFIAPTLKSMMAAESPEEFANLDAENNTILEDRPDLCLITPALFEEVGGAKLISANDLASTIIEAVQAAAADDDEISIEREAEAEGLEDTLAMLWASAQGLLKEIRLADVPESAMMSHLIRVVRSELSGEKTPAATTAGRTPGDPLPGEGSASMDLMAASSQSMVALLSRFQEGAESDR